jgi:hypothetical protein
MKDDSPYSGVERSDNDHDKEGDLGNVVSTVEEVGKESITLEVTGMDCPDCLSKVTGAVKVLQGANVTNADGVRGLVGVRYDPRE